MGLFVDVVIRLLALGFNSGVIKDMIKKVRDAKGSDLSPAQYADEMSKLSEVKAAEARAAVNG